MDLNVQVWQNTYPIIVLLVPLTFVWKLFKCLKNYLIQESCPFDHKLHEVGVSAQKYEPKLNLPNQFSRKLTTEMLLFFYPED
jgi:hypothetical protein